MKVILSEEQIKNVLRKVTLHEDENVEPQGDVVNDPFKRIRDATKNINRILSAPQTGYESDSYNDGGEYTDTADPMPNGPIAYADDKRAEYNVNVGVNQNWLNAVKATYSDFKGWLFHNQYNQGLLLDYRGYKARADCTGFICAALRRAGYRIGNYDSRSMVGKSEFTSQISGGFTRLRWNKTAYGTLKGRMLPPGTILVLPGHGMIVGEYDKDTKNLRGYDYGDNQHDENNPQNMRKIYTYAWIPKGE